MGEKNAGKAGVVLGGAALVTAAIALIKERTAFAAEGVVTLDEATMDLLIAMAQTGADVEELVARIIGSIEGGETTIQVQGYPPNAESIATTRVLIGAIDTAYGLPDIVVPDDMNLQLKGWPTNAGIIYVGYSRATVIDLNQVWPLLANEAIGYRVKNAKGIFISGTVPGDWLALTVEQRRG
jgi:hypothetical protein